MRLDRHVVVNLGLGVASAVAATVSLSQLRAVELVAVPAVLLGMNLLEYASHRWLMHRRTRILPYAFEAHVLRHHKRFGPRAMHLRPQRDAASILFGGREVALFLLATLPALVLAASLTSRNVALLGAAALAVHFVLYEGLHLAAHLPDAHWVAGHPWLASSRRRHARHHCAPRANFNVTFPFGDWLFGTLRRD